MYSFEYRGQYSIVNMQGEQVTAYFSPEDTANNEFNL
jgi:hypothetical protein